MTNQELFDKFVNIELTELNVFSKKCAIKKLEEEFKTTEYAQAFPELTVFDAYDEFLKEYGSVNSIIERFKQQLPELITLLGDKLSISTMFNEMDDSSKELMETLLANINK